MALRCKEGDLALVIHDEDCCKGNIGKLVKVAGPLGRNPRLRKNCWLIEPVKNEPWWCISMLGVVSQRLITFSNRMEHPDDWLLPVDPKTWGFDETAEEHAEDKVNEEILVLA